MLNIIHQELQQNYGDIILDHKEAFGETTITVAVQSIYQVIKTLRDSYRFKQVMDITAVDFPERENRFEVVYHLLNLDDNIRLRIKTQTHEDNPVQSVADIYKAADWWEREVYDLFGIVFDNHPDLRRILTDYGFEGYPMRKDFPTTGHVEVTYDEKKGKVVYVPVELSQSMREYKYDNPWQGSSHALHATIKKPESGQ